MFRFSVKTFFTQVYAYHIIFPHHMYSTRKLMLRGSIVTYQELDIYIELSENGFSKDIMKGKRQKNTIGRLSQSI